MRVGLVGLARQRLGVQALGERKVKITVLTNSLAATDVVAVHVGYARYRRELLRGVDVTDSHHGGMIAADPAGGIWFCDGVFHRSQFETPYGVHRSVDSTTLRHDLRTGRIETEWQSITPNPWKITFDRWGNTYQMYGDGLVLVGNKSDIPAALVAVPRSEGAELATSILADTDGDGLMDFSEDANRNGLRDPGETHPNQWDTDGDGIGDGVHGRQFRTSLPAPSLNKNMAP